MRQLVKILNNIFEKPACLLARKELTLFIKYNESQVALVNNRFELIEKKTNGKLDRILYVG